MLVVYQHMEIQQMMQTVKQILRAVIPRSQVDTPRQRLTPTLGGKQTPQRVPLHQTRTGQKYHRLQRTAHPIQACLKTFAQWVLAVLLALVYLGFLAANM